MSNSIEPLDASALAPVKEFTMLAEKFLLLLETLISRVVDHKPPIVTGTRAAFPNPPYLGNPDRVAFPVQTLVLDQHADRSCKMPACR